MKYILNDDVFSSPRTMKPRVNTDKAIAKVVITVKIPEGVAKKKIAKKVHKFVRKCRELMDAEVKTIYFS